MLVHSSGMTTCPESFMGAEFVILRRESLLLVSCLSIPLVTSVLLLIELLQLAVVLVAVTVILVPLQPYGTGLRRPNCDQILHDPVCPNPGNGGAILWVMQDFAHKSRMPQISFHSSKVISFCGDV